MKSSATSPTRNSSVVGATLSSVGEEDIQNFIDLLECSLDVGIDEVEVPEMHNDEGREITNAEGLNVEAHVPGSNVSPSLAQVIERKFECPEAVFCFYEQYSRGKGFSMRHGRKTRMSLALELVIGKHNRKAEQVQKLATSTWDRIVCLVVPSEKSKRKRREDKEKEPSPSISF
ncbi:hypothetical protein PIB30_005496 [Stylosanthes scabra]|uniref:Uncharacterized protein n=1 Tax=Stylosanthes scabra TaxID=79078 RepID=A0ABU6Z1W6_9FABA|nr:hypothetical protein [Stylosanthes scabra]